LLVSWCAGGRCGMTGSDEDRGRSRRPIAEDQGWSSTGRVLGDRMIERSDNVVCGLYCAKEMMSACFLVYHQNQC
jgi:hypothetical protein